VPGTEALSALEQLRRQGETGGFVAVLLGGERDVTFLQELLAQLAVPPEKVLEDAKAVDVRAWFSQRIAQDRGHYEARLGEWPTKPSAPASIMAHLDLPYLSRPKESVFIAKLPATNTWEVPAHLGLGGWNECPFPEELVAVSRYWYDTYGAEIAAVTSDTIEYVVDNPPNDRDTAEMLAREHFIYCTDIVHQGTGTLRNLAAGLVNAKVWFFWWD
jgi:hypothetical protein